VANQNEADRRDVTLELGRKNVGSFQFSSVPLSTMRTRLKARQHQQQVERMLSTMTLLVWTGAEASDTACSCSSSRTVTAACRKDAFDTNVAAVTALRVRPLHTTDSHYLP